MGFPLNSTLDTFEIYDFIILYFIWFVSVFIELDLMLYVCLCLTMQIKFSKLDYYPSLIQSAA